MSRTATVRGATRPGVRVFLITQDTDLSAPYPRAIITDADGPVELIASDDTVPSSPYLLAGVPQPIEVKRVNSAGTTATNVWGVR